MTAAKMVEYWLVSAQRDMHTIRALYASGDYHWCLFFWQLKLEKLLKAVLANKDKEVPFTHNLTILARKAGFTLSQSQTNELNKISAFNLEARYDDYKFSFYKQATKKFTDEWLTICKRWENGIRKML